MLAFKNILVPVDFSEHSEKAIQLAGELARGSAATVHLRHIVAPATINAGDVIADLSANVTKEATLKELEAVAVPEGLKVTRGVAEGEPAAAIIRLAMELKADLIVLGTHGRTGLKRLLLGSVAEHVLRHAPCPVLAWRQPATK